MTDKIVAKTVYKTSEDAWQNFTNIDKAKTAARASILDKFIRDVGVPGHYTETTKVGWFGKKTVDTYDKYVETKERSADDAKRDFIKFYPEIMAALKAVDEAPTPIPSTTEVASAT